MTEASPNHMPIVDPNLKAISNIDASLNQPIKPEYVRKKSFKTQTK